MALFEWEDIYSVNVQIVDEQHKHLIELINDLYRALLSDNPGDTLEDILDRMLLYATYHFQDEEALLAKYNYPRLESHKLKHEAYVEKTLEYLEKFRAGELKPSVEIARYLKKWLKDHIMGSDKEFTSFLNQRGVN